jgi:hypothetical protein
VEVFSQERWIALEGCILDKKYLASLQHLFPEVEGAFCGYGVATASFKHPPIDWQGQDTSIQKEGISNDYGVFDTPEAIYSKKGQQSVRHTTVSVQASGKKTHECYDRSDQKEGNVGQERHERRVVLPIFPSDIASPPAFADMAEGESPGGLHRRFLGIRPSLVSTQCSFCDTLSQ